MIIPLKGDVMKTQLALAEPVGFPSLVRQAQTDVQLLELWLHGRSGHTARYYRRNAGRFLAFVGKPLPMVTLGDVQAFTDTLADVAEGSRATAIASIKSLLTFGNRIGYLPVNVGAAVRLPKVKDTLAERILPELDVQRLIALLPAGRDHVMLRLCYAAGLRVSELVGIKRRDLQPRADGEGQVTVFGKGGKTRVILLPASVWREIQGVGGAAPDAPLFRSRKGGHLTTRQAQRIVEAAAQSAGIEAAVSPHWLRHAHVSHALDRGAPAHVVRDTVGHANLSTTSRYAHARPTESSARYLAV